MSKVIGVVSHTGEGSLASYDGDVLNDGDAAMVFTNTGTYIYNLYAAIGSDEDIPNVVSPAENAGTKRWILVNTLTT